MYAPFGGGVLIGPRDTFAEGDPFLAGGGAVDLVDLDEVVWTDPPDREEAGSPNVIGAVALHAAIDALTSIGWPDIIAHDDHLAGAAPSRSGRHRRSAPPRPRPPRAHPPDRHVRRRRSPPRAGGGAPQRRIRHRRPPRLLLRPPLPHPPPRAQRQTPSPPTSRPSEPATAPRYPAPCEPAAGSTPGPTTSTGSSKPSPRSPTPQPPVPYLQDPTTGDYWPQTDTPGWSVRDSSPGAPCSRG